MPESRRVGALRGAQWLVNAAALFNRSPRTWMVLVLILLLSMILSSLIPVVGPLVFGLVFPIFGAGLGVAARAADQGKPPQVEHLFAGFRASTSDLVAIGGIYLVGQLAVFGIMVGIGGSALFQLLSAGGRPPSGTTLAITGTALLGAAVGAAMLVPLLMATWYAPLLVFFHEQKVIAALRASLLACARNWVAFLIYIVALTLIMLAVKLAVVVLGLVPLIGPVLALAGLGAAIAVLVPVGFIAIYTSYIDVFAQAVAPDEALPDRVLLP
jgi:hypothetical protein